MPGSASERLDCDVTAEDISRLSSVDAIGGFLTQRGYPTGVRKEIPTAALGLSPELATSVRRIELIAQDDEESLSVLFVQLRSLTAKARGELVRNLGRRAATDHLLILTKDFEALEFVLVDKEGSDRTGPTGVPVVRFIPRVFSVIRKAVTALDRRILRRLTWTGKDGFEQFEKLRSVFQAAHFSEVYFENRALFADHYLTDRLKEDAAWQTDPGPAFRETHKVFGNARERWAGKNEQTLRTELYEPSWRLLGFKAKINKAADKDHLEPDYILNGPDGTPVTAAFTYRWDRWLDGPDLNDPETPDENPGAAVVSTLADGKIRWVIVSNGKFWRLYSKEAHSRATNYYEVDLEEALTDCAETDPNEAFRYWWLFFRREAFEPTGILAPADANNADKSPDARESCWLDEIVRGSRDYAKEIGDRLKKRIFEDIFPHIARGFLHDRRKRLGERGAPSEADLKDIFEATLTLLYRLLFLLYAEARDLLPIREAAYHESSLKKIKLEIADHAGIAETAADERLTKAYTDSSPMLYDRLLKLFAIMDRGDADRNVPCYNGGLFLTKPDPKKEDREYRIARFLLGHKVPDSFLAPAIDRLARDPDDKTCSLVNIDYKSLEVRHLGSIYEGLLEFKLKIAEEDLGVTTEKKKEKYIPLSQVKTGRGRRAAQNIVRKGEVYLSNDKAERKASGSYYTPDPIVEYIVEHTVGPVLEEKLAALKPELDKAAKTYHRHIANAKANPSILSQNMDARSFAEAKTYAEHRGLVEKVFDMKVLDPAMGSGHFLVEAVDFITDRLLDFLNRYPRNPVKFALDKTRRSILHALREQDVTVDPARLTDVNLLKRHVLKRCIYGVDLNPMAVELAKVSLWLDAFTLGAPLSFLDHHLRCGNSLIGATFEDLKKKTEGQLFGIDYEPLMRAIRHVLFVNEMVDATAAEVHQSAEEYAQARRDLSGYKIVLDLLVADHFIGGGATGNIGGGRRRTASTTESFSPSRLLSEAQEIDLSSREKFIASLDERARLTVEQVESVASRPDLRFFHWEIEFPEVFFGFIDEARQQIRHKHQIRDGSAGFDAVIGNPPYLSYYSRESQRSRDVDNAHQDYLASRLALLDPAQPAVSGRVNLFLAFLLLPDLRRSRDGRLALIVPDTLMINSSYTATRSYLLRTQRLAHAVQITDAVFEDATVGSCIVVLARTSHDTRSVSEWPFRHAATPTVSYPLDLANLLDVPHCPLRPVQQDQLLHAAAPPGVEIVPLGTISEVCDGINPGPAHVRAKLITNHDSCGTRRLIEGSCISPYRIAWGGKFVRYDPSLLTQEDRAAGASLRKPFLFEPKKIVYRQTAPHLIAAVDWHGYCATNSVHVIVPHTRTEHMLLAICAYLNSTYLKELYQAITGETRKVFPQVHAKAVKQLPVPLGLIDETNPISSKIVELAALLGGKHDSAVHDDAAANCAVTEAIEKLIRQLVGER